MEHKAYQVTYLVSLSTLPSRFFELIYNNKTEEKGNPGNSLRSFLIAKHLKDEIIQVTEPIETYIRECEEFSNSKKILGFIVDSLMKSSMGVLMSMESSKIKVQIEMVKDITDLQELINNVKATYDAYLSIQDPTIDSIDLFTLPGIKLKQSIFNLQDKIGLIIDNLNETNTPEPLETA